MFIYFGIFSFCIDRIFIVFRLKFFLSVFKYTLTFSYFYSLSFINYVLRHLVKREEFGFALGIFIFCQLTLTTHFTIICVLWFSFSSDVKYIFSFLFI